MTNPGRIPRRAYIKVPKSLRVVTKEELERRHFEKVSGDVHTWTTGKEKDPVQSFIYRDGQVYLPTKEQGPHAAHRDIISAHGLDSDDPKTVHVSVQQPDGMIAFNYGNGALELRSFLTTGMRKGWFKGSDRITVGVLQEEGEQYYEKNTVDEHIIRLSDRSIRP